MREKKHKDKSAAALGYRASTDNAPTVKAKGKGYIAEEIIKRAQENNVPIKEDSSLAELLDQLDVNETIPPELYEVVAEVFAFLYRMEKNSH
ncbi:EscU/YscU/HrcU family type III secretion system export apparatus switch protein [Bacillus piscicola]|uniref:EscU/YscU/HrcU family type III secretion system export apparatus switch protein n=1 Tax=Bacillus piscicola TaxID=1632684 RepID=UPI001F090E34|nr:EscU/YscU/HrcU family type III secretion system export apparatus switch protein [Bacillus piscicola]